MPVEIVWVLNILLYGVFFVSKFSDKNLHIYYAIEND